MNEWNQVEAWVPWISESPTKRVLGTSMSSYKENE
jgi:hypothetical protein